LYGNSGCLEGIGFSQQRSSTMMIDWEAYHRQLLAGIGEFGKLSPDTLKGYKALSTAGQTTQKLSAKTRELIALAVAVTARCDGCIVVHADAALKQGAEPEEIAEALGVAVALGAGAAMVYSARVLDAVAAKHEPGAAQARR
jgi:AhpD family alkylhydroperoxidase